MRRPHTGFCFRIRYACKKNAGAALVLHGLTILIRSASAAQPTRSEIPGGREDRPGPYRVSQRLGNTRASTSVSQAARVSHVVRRSRKATSVFLALFPAGAVPTTPIKAGDARSAALLQETFLDCGGDAQNHFCSNDQRGCAGQHEALRNAACAVHPCHSVLAEPKQPAAVVTVSLPAHAPGCVLFSQMVLVQVGCTEYLALGFCHVFLLRRLFKERGVMGRCSRCFDVRKRRGGAPLRKSLKTMFSFGIHPLKHHLKDAVFLVASHVRRAGTTRSKRIRQH